MLAVVAEVSTLSVGRRKLDLRRYAPEEEIARNNCKDGLSVRPRGIWKHCEAKIHTGGGDAAGNKIPV